LRQNTLQTVWSILKPIKESQQPESKH